MTVKPIVARPTARVDINEAISYYLTEGTPNSARRYVNALEEAFLHIARFPASGSPRYGIELNLSGLRSWPLAGFPFLIFYRDAEHHIDVWRVLHAERDIPEWMRDPGTRPPG
jgi:toxin ParE1/3/4